ncbi:MAG TPA: TPM domain-containing protein [Vicinamibacterales bacterium]
MSGPSRPVPSWLTSIDSTYRMAWILLLASLMCPTIGGSVTGGYYPFAFYILANIMRPDVMPSFRDAVHPLRVSVFVLALFSNVAFLMASYLRRSGTLPPSTRGLLVACLVVDVSVAIVLPDFAKAPAYWLWLASIAALVWSFVVLPSRAPAFAPAAHTPARRGPEITEDGTVPVLVWIWLGWIVFWLGVSYVPLLGPDAGPVSPARAATLVPHALTSYFNDEAQLFSPGDVERFNNLLAGFERDTSNQVAVAVYADAPDGAIEQFTIRTADLSRLGRKGLDNGAILFVFAKPRLARLEIGYGLESVVNDGKAGSRLDAMFVPAWQRGETVQAMDATLGALLEDVRGAYTGGRMPGPLAVFARQLVVEIPRALRGAWPVVSGMPWDARIGITFFGSLFALAFFDGLGQALRLLRNTVRGPVNLFKRRAFTTGFEHVQFDSVLDAVKVLVLFGVVIFALVGIVVIAGGGAFGGGGALRHW